MQTTATDWLSEEVEKWRKKEEAASLTLSHLDSVGYFTMTSDDQDLPAVFVSLKSNYQNSFDTISLCWCD